MYPADVATGLLSVCGGLIWLLFGSGVALAIGQAVRHRAIHHRLHLPWGFSELCPMCIHDREVETVPWHARFSRDLKRKQLKREEFEER